MSGIGIGDKVRIRNHKVYGFCRPWGWVNGFSLALGAYLTPHGPAGRVTDLIIAQPDPEDPEKNWYYLKTTKVPAANVSAW